MTGEFKIVVFNWLLQDCRRSRFHPLTNAVVIALKQAASEDYYDVNTRFTPFSLND